MTTATRRQMDDGPLTKATARWRLACLAVTILAAAALPTRQLHAAGTWAENLRFPKNKRIVILYGAQMGMCFETGQAGKKCLNEGWIQSASVMPTCPWFNEFAQWCRQHPNHDVGLSLTMTSELSHYRWPPLTPRTAVPSLVDSDGYLWRSMLQFSINAHSDDVRREMEVQIQKARDAGFRPSHLVPHLGALLSRPELATAYLETARKLWIPAVIIELTPEHIDTFRSQGIPLQDSMIELIRDYPLPKVDDLQFVPQADTYEQKRDQFVQMVQGLRPGITQIVARPAVESEAIKSIAEDWQQRVWDAQLLADPMVQEFFVQEGILFTNWKEIMRRFEGNLPNGMEERTDP